MDWYKYRECSSSGRSDWEYIQLDTEHSEKHYGDIEEYLKETTDCALWSEHFRGFDISKIRKPPRIVLKRQIEAAKKRAKYFTEKAGILQEELNEMPISSGDVKIIIFTMMEHFAGEGYKNWAIVSLNGHTIYKSNEDFSRDKVKERARKWCHKRNYDIISECNDTLYPKVNQETTNTN